MLITIHAYNFLGREISDTITTLGSGVDGSVMKIAYAYDAQGNRYLTTSYDGSGNIVNQVMDLYNGFGQLVQEFQSASGPVDPSTTPSVQYTYAVGDTDNDSRLASIVYPDGYTVNYNYSSGLNNAISRVSSISDSDGTLDSFTYQGLDTVVGTTGPEVTQAISLDTFGRVANVTWTHSSTTLVNLSYTYDSDGNVLTKTDSVNTSQSQTYSYDDLDELIGYKEGTISDGTIGSPSASQTLEYDALGNMTSNSIGSTTYSVNAQNEYTSVSGATTPTYDNNGNMTTDSAGLKYVYNAWNEVVAVYNSSDTLLETFEYDGLGRRIAVSNASTSTTTTFLYSNQGQVLEEFDGSDYTNRYVWSPVYVNALIVFDSMVEVGPTVRLYVLQDANYNVVALVNSSGSIVERYDYTPFGKVTIMTAGSTVLSSSAYGMVYLWQGMRQDTVTGNYAAQNRDYNVALQRWMTNDPEGLDAGDPNTYRAEGNDVTSAIDPSGLEPEFPFPNLKYNHQKEEQHEWDNQPGIKDDVRVVLPQGAKVKYLVKVINTREDLYDFVKDSDFKFVVTLNGELVILKNGRPHSCATGITPFSKVGGQVLSAGHAKFGNDKKEIDFNLETGHYQITGAASFGRPRYTQQAVDQALKIAQKQFENVLNK